jgi:hypothetical protein
LFGQIISFALEPSRISIYARLGDHSIQAQMGFPESVEDGKSLDYYWQRHNQCRATGHQ